MAIHIVWTADPKQAIRAADQMARKNIELEQKIRSLTGESKKSSLAYTRGMKANIKSTGDAKRAIGELERDQRRLQAEYAKAQKQKAMAAAKEKQQAKTQQAEETRLLAIRKRLYQETRTPQERYAAKMRELNALVRKGTIDQQTYRRAAKQAAEAAMSSGGQQLGIGRKVLGQLSSIAGALGVTGGIAGAVMLMKQGFENSLEVMREITNEISKAGNEIVAFAALQEGGTKAERVRQASVIARQYGVTERGEAFDTVQAMQSITGSFEKGMLAAETIFAATQVGMPIALGRELETLGIAQKMKPGEMLRMAYAAGQASGRTPEALTRAAPGMKMFDDKAFGMAFAGVLASGFPQQQLATYTRRGGMALSDTSSLMETFEELGVGEGATQAERLEALAKAGIDSMVKLEKAGLTEIRETEALATAIPLIAEIQQTQKEILQRAKPGLLVKERMAIEEELPWMKTTRELRVHAASYADEKAFGEGAKAALTRTKEQVERGRAFKRLGMEQVGPFRTYKEEEVEGVGTVPVSTVREEAKAHFGLFLKHLLFASGTAPGQAMAGVPITGQPISSGELTARLDREKQVIRREVEATAPEGLRQDIRQLRDAVERQTEAVIQSQQQTSETQSDRLENVAREQAQAKEPETRVIEAPALMEAL